jgi:hypothetical protein
MNARTGLACTLRPAGAGLGARPGLLGDWGAPGDPWAINMNTPPLRTTDTAEGYLGRAESRVKARLVSEAELPQGMPVSTQHRESDDEPVRLLAPVASTEYEAWRREGGVPGPPPGLFHLTLTLQSPIAGPLCLGWGCHFGLGLYVSTPP